ncbi:pyridoxamine 5'-phosphate oxidase family protein [Actinomadura sp. NPDC049753]|uniref:pyridoxamine 5'-phosphate oxidase family protein n=1 Tax=Actinomadura sp. NPDC049753 TaxID=3154739 RepID=UPI0034426D68
MTFAHWPDTVDDIIGGDQAVMLATVTPAGGVVLTPVTNFGARDRDGGTVTVNSSVGGWKKLQRIKRDPKVALAFHTRDHGYSNRPEYVLVQGTASLSAPLADYPETLGADWERFDGPRATGLLWNRWLRLYYTRVLIEVTVARMVVWPDLTCGEQPRVLGPALPSDAPEPHEPPGLGTAPRIDHAKAAGRLADLPETLLGWTGADGFPMVVPVSVSGDDQAGILLDPPPGILPGGGRRAGLTAHSFTKYVQGQHQRVHTGWLENGPEVRYAPHTELAYRTPPSRLVYRLGVGAAMRIARRRARRAGHDILQ